MNIKYTGRQGELPPAQQRKLDAKFATLAKLVERKGADKGAHVVITTERHLTHAEITVNDYDHAIVGVGSGPDYFTAMAAAIEKAEKQALKLRAKWRDTKKGSKEDRIAVLETVAAPKAAKEPPTGKGKPKDKGKAAKRAAAAVIDDTEETETLVNRVDQHEKRKPMTLEEAMIAIGNRDYLAYRDSDRDCLAVLIRRKDGSFDLVES